MCDEDEFDVAPPRQREEAATGKELKARAARLSFRLFAAAGAAQQLGKN